MSDVSDPALVNMFARISRASSIDLDSLDGLFARSDSLNIYSEEGMQSWKSLLQIQYNYSILGTNLSKLDDMLASLPS